MHGLCSAQSSQSKTIARGEQDFKKDHPFQMCRLMPVISALGRQRQESEASLGHTVSCSPANTPSSGSVSLDASIGPIFLMGKSKEERQRVFCPSTGSQPSEWCCGLDVKCSPRGFKVCRSWAPGQLCSLKHQGAEPLWEKNEQAWVLC